jgi:hypothetical protein
MSLYHLKCHHPDLANLGLTAQLKKQMTRRKKRSFDKARRTKKKSDIARYRKLKSATQKECRKAYKDYVENIIDPDLSSNPNKFWSFIKSKRCESTGVSPLKDSDGKTY